MPSVRSYFNPTLYRKHLTRYWPIWALYTIIWFFVLPINLILNSSTDYPGVRDIAGEFANRTVLRMLPEYGIAMAVSFGLLAAMAIWSYLYNNRAAGLIHALPIRREGLFFTGFLAGATFFVVPNALIFLLTLGAEAMAGTVNLGALALWFAVQTMYCIFFFCFATFFCFVTGHILVLPAFFFIFNFLAVGILNLVDSVLHNFVYGFAGLTGAWPVAEWLSPLYGIASAMTVSYERVDGVITHVALEGVQTMVIYTIAGLVLAALALLIYRRHQVEQAGEVVTARWLRPVFKYGVAFCGALLFGSLLYAIFSNVLSQSAWSMLFFVLLCGFLSYLAAEMLLQKSFRILKKSWKGCVVFLLVLVVATAAMELDITGYEKHIPAASEVERVTLYNVDSEPYDAAQRSAIDTYDSDLIWRIRGLHASVVDNKTAVEQGLLVNYSTDYYTTSEAGVSVQTQNSVTFNLLYTMKNGQKISRRYTIPVTSELLADPASPAALLEDILNNRENIAAAYFPQTVTAADFIAGTISFHDVTGNGEYEEVKLTAAEAGIIYEAAMEDLASGGLGRRYLLRDKNYYTQVFQNEIILTYYGIFPDMTTQTEAKSLDVCLYPQTDSVNLIAALQRLEVLDDRHTLVNQLEIRAAEEAYTNADRQLK